MHSPFGVSRAQLWLSHSCVHVSEAVDIVLRSHPENLRMLRQGRIVLLITCRRNIGAKHKGKKEGSMRKLSKTEQCYLVTAKPSS